MGMALAAGGGGGCIFMLCLATSHFSLLGHLKWRAEKRRLQGNFDYFSILICNLRLATFYFRKALEPPLSYRGKNGTHCQGHLDMCSGQGHGRYGQLQAGVRVDGEGVCCAVI
jgi:hypothetical protein